MHLGTSRRAWARLPTPSRSKLPTASPHRQTTVSPSRPARRVHTRHPACIPSAAAPVSRPPGQRRAYSTAPPELASPAAVRRPPSTTITPPQHHTVTMSGDPEREHALEAYKGKLLESREWEAKLKNLRLDIKGLQHDFDVSEDNIKALQSVGQIIGEVLKQLDEERCTSAPVS